MPRGRAPEGEHALSNAERQARYRARHLTQPAPVATRTRRLIGRRSRPQRWRDAVIGNCSPTPCSYFFNRFNSLTVYGKKRGIDIGHVQIDRYR